MTPSAEISRSVLPLHVVVLNWNLAEDTIACVRSVQANRVRDCEVVIVDNGSSDCSVQVLKQRLGDTVRLITSSTNLGFAAGVNLGFEEALRQDAQSILLLNNDTIVDPFMIMHLAEVAAKRAEVGVVGPVIYYHDDPGRVWQIGGREYRWLPIPLRAGWRSLSKAAQTPFRLDYVTGCGMWIRRSVLETVGLFDPHYFMYFEDVDFCRRVRSAGFEIWCAPRARMWHRVSTSARRQKRASRYAETWGRAHFYRMHPHGPSRALTIAHVVLKAARITLRDLLLGQRELLVPVCMGTLDGLLDRPPRVSRFLV